MGLPVITLHKVWAYLSGNFGVVSESQTLPRGPFHPETSVVAHQEMKSALPGLSRLPLSAPRDRIKKTFVVAFDLRRNLGHLGAFTILLSASVEHKLPRAAGSHQ